jgi:hypothetical protein
MTAATILVFPDFIYPIHKTNTYVISTRGQALFQTLGISGEEEQENKLCLYSKGENSGNKQKQRGVFYNT